MNFKRKGILRRIKCKEKLTYDNIRILYSDLMDIDNSLDEVSIILDIVKRSILDRRILILDCTGKVVEKIGTMNGCRSQFIEEGVVVDVKSIRLTGILSELFYVVEKRLFFARDSPLLKLQQNTIVFIKPSNILEEGTRGLTKFNDYISYVINNPLARCNIIIIDNKFWYDECNLSYRNNYIDNRKEGDIINAVDGGRL